MRSRTFIVLMALLVCTSSTLRAGVVPGRWEKVAAENLGAKFIVTMLSGERIDGYFRGMSEDHLKLTMLDGQERAVRKTEVAKIITGDRRMGSLTNGFLIGLGIGAGIPAIAAASMHDDADASAAIVIILGGLIGGAIGVGIDAAVQGHITLYQAPKGQSGP
jgi:hypothetical protein